MYTKTREKIDNELLEMDYDIILDISQSITKLLTMSSVQSVIVECCICMDNVDTTVNCLTTPCGHCFHANCYLKHTSYNGYNCPLCRSQMFEQPENTVDEEESLYEDDSDDEFEDEEERFEIMEAESLQSFRWFYQRLNNEQLEEDEEGFSEAPSEEELQEEETIRKENEDQVKALVSKMKCINKLPYEKLLAAFLYNNVEDFTHNEYAGLMCNEVSSMLESVHRRVLNES